MDLSPRAAIVVVNILRLGSRDSMSAHRPSALGATGEATREHPRSVVVLGELNVVLDSLTCQVNPLSRDARVGNGNGYPLLLRPLSNLHAPLVALAVGTVHCLLVCLRSAPVEPPDAVILLRVEPRGNLRRHLTLCYQPLDLLMGVRPVSIVPDCHPDKELPPNILALGSWQTFSLEGAFHGTYGSAFCAHHADDALYDRHSLLVHLVAIPRGVVAEAIVRALGGYDFAFSGLPELPSATPLGDLEALVAGDLVQYASR